MTVGWFSAGVSSFIACYLVRNQLDEIIYNHIENQHPDTLRFLHDCEQILQRPITIIKSDYFRNVDDVLESVRFINAGYGAPCTHMLKIRVRQKWESEHKGRHTYIWGFDKNEQRRADNMVERMPNHDHKFPLIEYGLSKQNVHALCAKLGIQRPIMYDMGYPNNNCIGCVRGGMGYWNKIRVDFPDVFKRRCELERRLGKTHIKGIYLDELDPNRGNLLKEIFPSCGIGCEILLDG